MTSVERKTKQDICRLFVLECKLSTSSKCADLLDGPTLNWWAGDDGNLNLDNSIMDKCMKRTIAERIIIEISHMYMEN